MEDVARRLATMEHRLDRLEAILQQINRRLDQPTAASPPASIDGIKQWVTEVVNRQLDQLVPGGDHRPVHAQTTDGPHLEGTEIPCTDEVVHRMWRIPLPFVRQMVIQKVAEAARQVGMTRVDVPFFERAANF